MDRNSEANPIPTRATPPQPSQEAMEFTRDNCSQPHGEYCIAYTAIEANRRPCNCGVETAILAAAIDLDALVQRAVEKERERAETQAVLEVRDILNVHLTGLHWDCSSYHSRDDLGREDAHQSLVSSVTETISARLASLRSLRPASEGSDAV